MNSLIKSKPKPNVLFGRAWKIVVTLLIFVYLLFRFFPTFLYRVTEPFARPLWGVKDFTMKLFGDIPSQLTSKQTLINENELLKRRVQELQIQVQDTTITNSTQNNLLTQYAEDKGISTILARVISRPSQSPYDMFVVDTAGKTVHTGDLVTGPANIALGTVTEVFGKSAKVLLFSSASVETEAELSQSGATVILKGNGGGNFSVVLPKGFEVKTGDYFVRPNFRDSILAQVGSIEESEADSFKKITLSYPVSIFSLDWVVIHAQ